MEEVHLLEDGVKNLVEIQCRNYEMNLLQEFSEFLNKESYVDVSIVCDKGGVVKAHRLVLGSVSPFLRELFDQADETDITLYLPGVRYKDMLALLNILYVGHTASTLLQFNRILKLATVLQVQISLTPESGMFKVASRNKVDSADPNWEVVLSPEDLVRALVSDSNCIQGEVISTEDEILRTVEHTEEGNEGAQPMIDSAVTDACSDRAVVQTTFEDSVEKAGSVSTMPEASLGNALVEVAIENAVPETCVDKRVVNNALESAVTEAGINEAVQQLSRKDEIPMASDSCPETADIGSTVGICVSVKLNENNEVNLTKWEGSELPGQSTDMKSIVEDALDRCLNTSVQTAQCVGMTATEHANSNLSIEPTSMDIISEVSVSPLIKTEVTPGRKYSKKHENITEELRGKDVCVVNDTTTNQNSDCQDNYESSHEYDTVTELNRDHLNKEEPTTDRNLVKYESATDQNLDYHCKSLIDEHDTDAFVSPNEIKEVCSSSDKSQVDINKDESDRICHKEKKKNCLLVDKMSLNQEFHGVEMVSDTQEQRKDVTPTKIKEKVQQDGTVVELEATGDVPVTWRGRGRPRKGSSQPVCKQKRKAQDVGSSIPLKKCLASSFQTKEEQNHQSIVCEKEMSMPHHYGTRGKKLFSRFSDEDSPLLHLGVRKLMKDKCSAVGRTSIEPSSRKCSPHKNFTNQDHTSNISKRETRKLLSSEKKSLKKDEKKCTNAEKRETRSLSCSENRSKVQSLSRSSSIETRKMCKVWSSQKRSQKVVIKDKLSCRKEKVEGTKHGPVLKRTTVKCTERKGKKNSIEETLVEEVKQGKDSIKQKAKQNVAADKKAVERNTCSSEQVTDQEDKELIIRDKSISIRKSNKVVKKDDCVSEDCIEKPKSEFYCKVCDMCFTTEIKLNGHMRKHAAKKSSLKVDLGLFQCRECNKKFINQNKLNAHMRKHSIKIEKIKGSKSNVCDECYKPFQTWSQVKKHKSTVHSEARPYQCEICGKTFKVRKDMFKHKIIHSDEKPYTCSICNTDFKRPDNIRSHMRAHLGIKTHTCEFCGKGFVDNSSLRKHMPFHTGLRAYRCDICGKAYKWRHQMRRHQVSHTGYKPAQCAVCGIRFSRGGDLKVHMRIHTGEKPYECEVCGERFYRLDYMKKHRVKHSGHADGVSGLPVFPVRKVFICSLCGHQCIDRASLRKHNFEVHIEEKTASETVSACTTVIKSEPDAVSPEPGGDVPQEANFDGDAPVYSTQTVEFVVPATSLVSNETETQDTESAAEFIITDADSIAEAVECSTEVMEYATGDHVYTVDDNSSKTENQEGSSGESCPIEPSTDGDGSEIIQFATIPENVAQIETTEVDGQIIHYIITI